MGWMLCGLLLVVQAAGQAVDAVAVDDGAEPFLMVLSLAALAVVLVLVGAGVVIAAVIAASLAALALAGVVSTSLLVGLYRRRLSSGLRMLYFQLGAVSGVPAGVGLLWLIDHLRDGGLGVGGVIGIGAVAGAAGGLLLVWLLDRLTLVLARRLMRLAQLRFKR